MKNLQLPFFVASSYEGKTKDKEDSSMDNALGFNRMTLPKNEDSSSPKSEIGDWKDMRNAYECCIVLISSMLNNFT